MTTLASLADEIVSNLQGYTVSPDQVTFLTGDLAIGATTLAVDDSTQVGSGIAQIDDELVYIKGIDQSSGTVTLAPFGRGYKGTTAASHTANTMLVMSPDWPRFNIKREINRSILSLYPTLYAVKDAGAFTTDGLVYQFDVPADAERVVDVRYLAASFDGWQRAVMWEQENSAPSGFGVTGRYVSIYQAIPGGATVQVLYAARPTVLANDSDDFTTTGLTESCADLVVLSVMARMVQFLDVGRLPSESASADALAQQKPVGTPTQISAQLNRQFQDRLEQERRALSTRYPARPHKVR